METAALVLSGLLISELVFGVVIMPTYIIVRGKKILRERKRLNECLEKNRQWYKDDKTITYEVNPMFNKLCRTY